jgi:hypothetical protein
MAGNVAEWCAPAASGEGRERPARGGSCYSAPVELAVKHRLVLDGGRRYLLMGIRPARSLSP